MYVAEKIREPAQVSSVALKAYARVADAWGLSLKAVSYTHLDVYKIQGQERAAK